MCAHVGTGSLTPFKPLSTHISKAIIVVVVCALLSILAFALIVIRIIRDATFNPSRRPKVLFFRTQLGHYAGCLVLSNACLSVAGSIDIYWLIHSRVTPGSTCSAQAVLMQIGVWGTCWFTVAHGVHTLISLMFYIRQVYWHSAVIITIGWALAVAGALVPLKTGNVYGPAGISCGIVPSYSNEINFLGALPIILSTSLTTAVYSLTLIVWYMRQSTSNRRTIRGFSSACRRGENKSAEYYRLINTIIWTTSWFPVAFVFLMVPFGIVDILVHAGQQVSTALNIFADACASILGFVNVCLLLNTLRVISHMTRVANMATETMTFGHDASREHPTGPHSQSEVSSYESNCRTYNSTQASHSHSSSVDSNTELMHAEEKSYAFTQAKAAPLSKYIIPPAELSRQLDKEPGITLSRASSKRDGIRLEMVTSTAPMGNISLSPFPVDKSRMQDERMQDEKFLFEPMADTEPFGRGAEELGWRHQVPVKVDLSDLPIRPPPISHPLTHKLTASAMRKLGVPAASPQIPAALLGPENADQSIRRVSTTSSFHSTGTSDSDSDCSGQLMEAYKVRLSSHVSQLVDDVDSEVFRGSMLPHPQRPLDLARINRDTVWSQESEDMTEDEFQEAYWQLIAELLGDLGVSMLGDQADAPENGLQRQSTFGPHDARPQTLRIQPGMMATSKCSHFADMLNPKSKPEPPTTKSTLRNVL